MKHIKTFESFTNPVNEELFGFGKKTYKLGAEFKPDEDSLEFIKYNAETKKSSGHPAAGLCVKDFKRLYQDAFKQELSTELAVQCVQATFMFADGVPQLSRFGFEFNKKGSDEISLTINPNGKGLFSGHPIMG